MNVCRSSVPAEKNRWMLTLLVSSLGVVLSSCATTAGPFGPPEGLAFLTGRVVFRGEPPRPKLIRPFDREGWALEEKLLVDEDGGVANAVVTVEVHNAPEWKSENATVVISGNKARPRITFVSPGATAELQNEHKFDAIIITNFCATGAFEISPRGSTIVRVVSVFGSGMIRFRG